MNLDEIERRANAATPAPWTPPTERERGPGCDDRACVVDHEGCAVWPWHRREDMEFAYAARADVPALVALVRELEEEREQIRARLEAECERARGLEDERDALIVRVAQQDAELRATREAYRAAYRRGAEAMREACAVLVSNEKRLWLRSELIADLRALPIPGEP